MLKIIDFDSPAPPSPERCRVAMRTKGGRWRAWRCRLNSTHVGGHQMGNTKASYASNDPSFDFFTSDLECDTWEITQGGSWNFGRMEFDRDIVVTDDEMTHMAAIASNAAHNESLINEVLRERFEHAQNH